jgi:hypothetical protein
VSPPVVHIVRAPAPERIAPNMAAREIPDVLLGGLGTGETIERYIAGIVGQLRSADRDGDGLDRDDIELGRKVGLAQSRASRIGQVLRYDLDGDNVVTREELAQSFAKGTASRGDYLLKEYDHDHDGRITLTEAAQTSNRPERDDSRRDSLLALDPNGDGRLTPAELQPMAERAFKIVDRDGDGTISRDEEAAIAEQRSLADWLRSHPACSLPPARSDETIVAVSIGQGQAVSSAAIGGQDRVTGLIDIPVQPGSGRLYLVLTSSESTIWRLSGDTARVAQVAVLSESALEGAPRATTSGTGEVSSDSARTGSASGVIGAPPHTVEVADSGCWTRFTSPDTTQGRKSLALIGRSLGRDVDAAFATYAAKSVTVPAGTIARADEDEAAPTPSGFDARTWERARQRWPAGLVQVDPKAVVARAPVDSYLVLPDKAGLAELVGSGAVEYIDERQFRIVRAIPHLPPGMNSWGETKLILAKGVPLPPGNPGNACIVSEERGPGAVETAACRPSPPPIAVIRQSQSD